MADLILEFGCQNCYLQDSDCGADCTFELRIDLNQLFSSAPPASYFQQGINGTFTVKKDFFYKKRVPDVYRYDLKFVNGQGQGEWKLFDPNSSTPASQWETTNSTNNENKYKAISKNKPEDNNILVFLESPHNDEYDYTNNFAPLQPANGSTGKNFFTYFTNDILNSPIPNLTPIKALKDYLDSEKSYRICFVNPVPFQTSLHYIHRHDLKSIARDLRDIVWKKLFIQCQSDFIYRVKLYEPFAILNACTGDIRKRDSLKSQVKAAIDADPIYANYGNKFNTAHPTSWSKPDSRYCKTW